MKMHRTILIVVLTFLSLANRPVPAAEPSPLDLEYDCQAQWDAMILYFNDHKVRRRTDRAYNEQAGIHRKDEDPTTVILRRTEALLEDIKTLGPTKPIAPLEKELADLRTEIEAAPKAEWDKDKIRVPSHKKIKDENGRIVKNKDVRYPLFKKVYLLQRKIAFANPLVNFDKILFLKRNPAAYSHMVDQYFGISQHPGGGVFVLENAFTDTPKVRNLLENSVVQNGRLKGKKLTPGSFLSPDLSFDGKNILFAYVELDEIWTRDKSRKEDAWSDETCFHIFEVDADGSNLKQLTDGPYNDFDPCYLPNGRICFISERRGGQGRCHPARMCPSYVLHSMLPDGSDIVPLSYHETNEWHPSVTNQGEIIYSRWDYVDRAIAAGEYPWITKPDGRDTRAVHGNFEQARLGQTEFEPMPIPDNPSQYIGVLSAHHNQSYGGLSIFDASVWDYENEEQAVRYYTPEDRGGHGSGAYSTPWPLSTDYMLCVWSPLASGYYNLFPPKGRDYCETPVKHGIYLLDAFGNKILIYRDKEISCHNPIPFRPRKMPPRLPHMVDYAYPPDMQDKKTPDPDEMSTLAVMDVYQSLFPWPEDRKIKSLRVVQILPKPTLGQDRPKIGYASMMSARINLGTVPVESDGSIHFKLPPKVPVYFQALDEKGMAIQSMMTVIYTHPGEMLTCQGCHEPKANPISQRTSTPIAMQREASTIEPEVNNGEPVSFARLVQPVLDAKCVGCHEKEDKAPSLKGESYKRRSYISKAYKNLEPFAWYVSGRNDKYKADIGWRSEPGKVGAAASKLYPMLTTGSHKDKVQLTEEEMRRITLWIDVNSPFLGTFDDPRAEAAGELVEPSLE
jgi:cytochrome c553